MNKSAATLLLFFSLLSFFASGQNYSLQKGNELLEKGSYAESEEYFIKARDSSIQINNDTLTAEIFHQLAKNSLFQGKGQKSLESIEKGLIYARAAEYSQAYIKLLLFKSEYYGMKGNKAVGRASWREVKSKMKFSSGFEISALRTFALAYLNSPSDTCDYIIALGIESALKENDSIRISNHYRTAAERATIKSDYTGAIENCIAGEEYVPDARKENKGWFLILIANSFLDLKNYTKAEEYIEQTINLLEKTAYKKLLNEAYESKASICEKQGKFNCAMEYWQKATNYARSKPNYPLLFSTLSAQLHHNINVNNKKEVNRLKLELDKIESKLKYPRSLNRRNETLTAYHYFLKSYGECSNYLNQWEQTYSLVANPNSKIQFLKYKQLLLEKLNKPDESLKALKAYKQLKDSIESKKQLSLIYLMEGEFKQKEKESEIAKLNGINLVKDAKLKQRNKFLVFGGLFLIIALFVSWLLWSRNKKIKFQQQEISKNLSEKDILLDEIHFRVKNSLQTISSILNLQARSIEDKNALEAIQEGRNRVNSMALLHENLSAKNQDSLVEMKGYFEQLLSHLFQSYNIKDEKIRLEKNLISTNMNIDRVVLVGLILNELVSNALKHAFAGIEQGILKVEFYKEANKYHLLVTDNGVGKKDGDNSGKGFGSKIIQTFSKKLNAQVSQVVGNGTSIRISFPVD